MFITRRALSHWVVFEVMTGVIAVVFFGLVAISRYRPSTFSSRPDDEMPVWGYLLPLLPLSFLALQERVRRAALAEYESNCQQLRGHRIIFVGDHAIVRELLRTLTERGAECVSRRLEDIGPGPLKATVVICHLVKAEGMTSALVALRALRCHVLLLTKKRYLRDVAELPTNVHVLTFPFVSGTLLERVVELALSPIPPN